jgi:hypothetical protein
MHSRNRRLAFVSLLPAWILGAQLASGQAIPVCQATNTLALGTYGFVLNTGSLFTGVVANPPGTTSAVTFQALVADPPGTTYSTTQVGRLLSGLAGVTVGAVTGQFYLDGNGNIFASSTVGGSPSTIVGSYVINSDCTVTVTITDAFSTASKPPQASLSGFLVNGGTQLDLSPPVATAGTPKPPTTLLRIVRIPSLGSCTVSTLTGAYALTGQGLTSANAVVVFLARIRFDGTGNLVNDAGSSLFTSLQYVGTYTVNSDCTGTLNLSPTPAANAAPPKTPSIVASFVITNPYVQVTSSGNVAFQNPSQLRPSIIFTFANQNEAVLGAGNAQ